MDDVLSKNHMQLLANIGLTSGEIKVYDALLQLRESGAGQIVKDAGIHSSKVYPILDRLIDKGFVSFVQLSNKRLYRANPPSTIIDFLDAEAQKLQEQKREAEELVDMLEKLEIPRVSEATIFKGMKGFLTAIKTLAQTANKDGEILMIGVNEFSTTVKTNVWMNFRFCPPKMRLCLDENSKEWQRKITRKDVKMKVLKNAVFPSLVITYKDMTIISVGQGSTTFFITDEEVAASYRGYFESFWKKN